MVRHTMHFYVDGERIDYTIEYEKSTADKFPIQITICRSIFNLKSTNFVVHEDLKTQLSQLHLHAHYHVKVERDLILETNITLLENSSDVVS